LVHIIKQKKERILRFYSKEEIFHKFKKLVEWLLI